MKEQRNFPIKRDIAPTFIYTILFSYEMKHVWIPYLYYIIYICNDYLISCTTEIFIQIHVDQTQ